MDALDRMIVELVRVIRTSHPQYLTGPFEVGELHQTILPYRHFRRELLIETNQEYEFTLTQLLSGARGYLMVDDRMRDALEAELASPNPDTEKFRRFAELRVALSPAAVEREVAAGGGPSAVAAPDGGTSVQTPQRVTSTVRLSTPSRLAHSMTSAMSLAWSRWSSFRRRVVMSSSWMAFRSSMFPPLSCATLPPNSLRMQAPPGTCRLLFECHSGEFA